MNVTIHERKVSESFPVSTFVTSTPYVHMFVHFVSTFSKFMYLLWRISIVFRYIFILAPHFDVATAPIT